MEREVRYCTTEDGARIAYTVTGEGPPLVMCPFFVESFSVLGKAPEYMEFVEGLGRGRQVVQFDMRGTGLSQRDVAEFTLQSLTLEIKAVVRALRLRRIVLYGPGLSGPRAIAYAAAYPRDVGRLVLYSTFARPTEVMPEGAGQAFAQLARSNWHVAAQAMADLSGRERVSDLNVRGAQMIRDSTDGETAARLIEAGLATFDVSGALASAVAPTLVIQSTRTQLFKPEFGRELASGMPKAQLRLVDVDNWLDPGAGTTVASIVDEFLGVAPAGPMVTQDTGAFRAVLFTDLVGHTEMMSRLGDLNGREILREHEQITREALGQFGGVEVKTDGDSFMVSFGSAVSAVECAVALQRAFARRNEAASEPLMVRIGLDAGEPIEEEGDLFGATVILASRICAEAAAGEILIPDGVRGLLSGKNFSFRERGAFVPKGFADPVRLHEVLWRG